MAERLVAAGTTDVRSVREIIWQRFLTATGTQAELDYRQDVSTSRLLAAVRDLQPGSRPDVVFVSDPAEFAAAGMAEQFESSPDSNAYPEGWLDPDRRWWPLYVQPVVCVHNAYRGEPPRTWLDLVDSRFRDRIVLRGAVAHGDDRAGAGRALGNHGRNRLAVVRRVSGGATSTCRRRQRTNRPGGRDGFALGWPVELERLAARPEGLARAADLPRPNAVHPWVRGARSGRRGARPGPALCAVAEDGGRPAGVLGDRPCPRTARH